MDVVTVVEGLGAGGVEMISDNRLFAGAREILGSTDAIAAVCLLGLVKGFIDIESITVLRLEGTF